MNANDVIGWLSIWSILGFLFIDRFPKPQHGAAAFQIIFLSGPIGWTIFLCVLIQRIFQIIEHSKRSKNK